MISAPRRARAALVASFAPAIALSALLALVPLACSSSSTSPGTPLADVDASGDAAPAVDGATETDAATGTDGAAATCEGACKTTSISATFGGKTRTLVRAQHGTQTSDAGVRELHVESHLGGAAACPDQSSPTPEYTLVTSKIPRGRVGATLTEKDGVTAAFFDFKGDLGLPPFTKAKTLTMTVVAEDAATPPQWVAVDVRADFAEGSVNGHLYATYCASLSE